MKTYELLKGDGVIAFECQLEEGRLYSSLLVSKSQEKATLSFPVPDSIYGEALRVCEIKAPGVGVYFKIDLPAQILEAELPPLSETPPQ